MNHYITMAFLNSFDTFATMKRYWLFLVLLCTLLSAYAQSYQLSFQHINRTHSLPDARVTTLHEHHQLLYIGTEDGLYIFNGGGVFKIPLDDSLARLHITSMVSDPFGNLWIGSNNGLFIYTSAEKVIAIHSYAGKKINYIETVYIDTTHHLWLLSATDNNALITYHIPSSRLATYGNNYNSIKAYQQKNGLIKKLWFKENKGVYSIEFNKNKPIVNSHWNGKNNSAMQVVNDIFVDDVGNAFVSTKKGIQCIPSHPTKNEELLFSNLYPENVNSSLVYKDVLILSTSHQGIILFHLPSKRVIRHIKEDYTDETAISSNHVKFCKIMNGCLYVVHDNNKIDYCSLVDNEFMYLQNEAKMGFNDIAVFENHELLIGADSAIYELNQGEFQPATRYTTPIERLQTLGSKLFTISANHVHAYSNTSFNEYTFQNSFVTSIYGFQYINNELLANTNSGIYQLFDKKPAPINGLQNETYKWYEHFLVVDSNTLLINAYYSYFLIVKKRKGIYQIENLLHHVEKVNQLIMLPPTTATRKQTIILAVADESIGQVNLEKGMIKRWRRFTNEPFYRIIPSQLDTVFIIKSKSIEKCILTSDTFTTLQTWRNIPTENLENNDAALVNGTLHIPLQKGLLIFNPNCHQPQQYKLYINNVQVNKKTIAHLWAHDTLQTPFSKSEISMDVGLWSSHIHHQTYIKYFLSKVDAGSVTEGKKSKIYFEKLRPGKHVLTVQALDREGKILAEKNILIIIQKEWYQTAWFYIGVGVLILTLGYLLFRWRLTYENKKIRKEELLLRKVKESENLALRSQMNPHFIFNTLNSINTYIVNEDNENASAYLNILSKLIRNTLDLTRSEKVTLEQELTTLKLYMDIEKSRTGFKFDYTIDIDKEIEPSFIKVPPLIIQPFVENSIWHGIQGLQGKGSIRIEIKQEKDNLITIGITDNGIGRKAEPNKNKKSHGLEITAERLSILHPKSHFEIIDLLNEKKEPSGTKAIIYLYS